MLEGPPIGCVDKTIKHAVCLKYRRCNTSNNSSLPLRVDRLAAFEHLDKGRDLLSPSGLGLQFVEPEGKREAVLRTQFLKHCPGPRLGVDCGPKILGGLHFLAALIGAVPAPVGPGPLDLP